MLLEKENKNTKVIYKADEVISKMYDKMKSVVVAPINGDKMLGKKSIVQIIDFGGNVQLIKVENDDKYNLVCAFVLNTAYENLYYHEFKVIHKTYSAVIEYYKKLGLVDRNFVIEPKSDHHAIVDVSSQQLNVLSEKLSMLTHKDCETPVSKKRYLKFIGTDGKVYYVFNAARHRNIISILHSMNCVWDIDTEITDKMYNNVISTYSQLGVDIVFDEYSDGKLSVDDVDNIVTENDSDDTNLITECHGDGFDDLTNKCVEKEKQTDDTTLSKTLTEYEKMDTRPLPIDHMNGEFFDQLVGLSTLLLPPNGFKVKCSHFVMCDGKPMSTVNTGTRQCNSCKAVLTYEECYEVADSINRIMSCRHVITDDSGTLFWNVTSEGRCRTCGANVQQIIFAKTNPPQKPKEPDAQPIEKPQLWINQKI